MNGADLSPDVAVADVLRSVLLDWSGLGVADVTAQVCNPSHQAFRHPSQDCRCDEMAAAERSAGAAWTSLM